MDSVNEELIKPLTIEELFNAIKHMPGGKVLGHDGIPIEFFKMCWRVIGEDFHKTINMALEKGEFHQGMTKGLIILIPKDKDHSNLEFWRPITILTVAYKNLHQSYAT